MATQQIIIGGSYQPPPPVTEQLYEIPGSYTFVVPSGINPATISVVAVGGGGGNPTPAGGGGGGGGLGYKNGLSAVSYTHLTLPTICSV